MKIEWTQSELEVLARYFDSECKAARELRNVSRKAGQFGNEQYWQGQADGWLKAARALRERTETVERIRQAQILAQERPTAESQGFTVEVIH